MADEAPVEAREAARAASEDDNHNEVAAASPGPDASGADVRDALPDDLDVTGFVGPYKFPDNSRRRIPGFIYLGLAALSLVFWLARRGQDPVMVNGGYVLCAALLATAGLICLTSGWRMTIDEKDALVVASAAVGFPVGHASAQLAWRGLRSRPTWRILCYSPEEPPTRRGFVLIDAVDGSVVSRISEDNPETDLED